MFVLTIDQRRSRTDVDRVPDVLERFADRTFVRTFDRTAGDEVQAVTDDATLAVDIALALVESGFWSVGIGVGRIDEPLPTVTRAGRGPAFEAARDAVTRAKGSPGSLAVTGNDLATDAQAVLTLLALLIVRRSDEGRVAVNRMRHDSTQAAAASALGISRQAMSQRLSVAGWQAEDAGRITAARLLSDADGTLPS